MTKDYDRISADDLSCQTEDRLDQTEGEQTTGSANKLRKTARKAVAKKASKKTSAKQTPAKKVAQKAAKKVAKKEAPKKASVNKTSAKKGAKRTTTATKAEVRAQTLQAAEARLLLSQQIDAIFDERTSPSAKGRAAQKRAAKTEAKGLVWTLSALALAACGGGGGSPAPVTGGSGNDYLYGGEGNDTLDGVDDDNTLIGQGGADLFVLNRDATGVSTVTDFNKSEGDHVLVYISSGEPKASLSDLGLAVHAHGSADTKITSASDSSNIYMILVDVLHTDITIDEFEII